MPPEPAAGLAPADDATIRRPGNRLAVLVGVLAAAMATAILPLIAIGVLAPLIIRDLDIQRAAIGALVSIASGVSAVLSPTAGRVVDRVGSRTALLAVLALGLASLSTMATATGYVGLGVAAAFAGLCHSGANPATNRVISGRVARGRRGWITGLKQSGEALAIVLGGSLLPATALALGWRGAVAVIAVVALVALVVAAIGVDPMPSERRAVAGADGRLRSSIVWLAAYNLMMGSAGGALTTYLPLFAHEAVGQTVAVAGGVMVLAGAVAVAGRVLWSRWAETRFGVPRALAVLAGSAVAATLALLAADAAGATALWIGAALWGASGLSFGSVAMLAAMSESDDATTGRASGLTVLGFGIGLTTTPPVFGWLVDRSGTYVPGLLLVAACYGVAAVIMMIGRGRFLSRDAGSMDAYPGSVTRGDRVAPPAPPRRPQG